MFLEQSTAVKNIQFQDIFQALCPQFIIIFGESEKNNFISCGDHPHINLSSSVQIMLHKEVELYAYQFISFVK